MGEVRPHPEAVARTTDAARAGRSSLDRLMLRFPLAYRAALKAILALPVGSSVRRAALRSTLTDTLAAFNRRDYALNTLAHHRDFRLGFGQPIDRPAGAREEYVGIEGLLDFLDLWLEVLGDYRFEFLDLHDIARNRIAMVVRQTSGGGEAPAVDERVAVLMDFRDGYLARQVFWRDPGAALRSLGLDGGIGSR